LTQVVYNSSSMLHVVYLLSACWQSSGLENSTKPSPVGLPVASY
jgi:hypothetical protein